METVSGYEAKAGGAIGLGDLGVALWDLGAELLHPFMLWRERWNCFLTPADSFLGSEMK